MWHCTHALKCHDHDGPVHCACGTGGYALSALRDAGCGVGDELAPLGYLPADFRDAGYLPSELKGAFGLADLKAGGFTLVELQQCYGLSELRAAFSVVELKAGGYSIWRLTQCMHPPMCMHQYVH